MKSKARIKMKEKSFVDIFCLILFMLLFGKSFELIKADFRKVLKWGIE